MVGRSVDLSIERVHTDNKQVLLKVDQLTVLDEEKVKALDGVTFELSTGEILGVAGVAGSGQKELCEAIAGLYPVLNGQILYDGDNIILKEYQNNKGLLIDRKPAREKAKKLVKKLDIKTPGINHPVKKLSCGNIQKVLLGREIESNPNLLITAYPVRGLDIGSSYTIYDLLNEQKKKGVAVLFIGEDLDVLLELCDRIMVLCNGKITGIVEAGRTTKDQLGLMMAGERLIPGEAEDIG